MAVGTTAGRPRRLRITLRARLAAGVTALTAAAAAFLTLIAYLQAASAVRTIYQDQLAVVASSRIQTLGGALEQKKRALESVAKEGWVTVLLRSMTQAFEDAGAEAVRTAWIVENPAAPAEREKVASLPGDASLYGVYHKAYHERLVAARTALGAGDLALVSPGGSVLYTVAKRGDFAATVMGAAVPASLQPLATPVAGTAASLKAGKPAVTFGDFVPYEPAGQQVGTWMVAAVAQEGAVSGYVAAFWPVETFSGILQDRAGLGKTGQVAVLGADGRARLSSGDLEPGVAGPDWLRSGLASAGGGDAAIAPGRRLRFRAGAAGGGVRLAVAEGVTYDGLSWVVVAHGAESEALAPVETFRRQMTAAGLGVAVVGAFLALVIAAGISSPVRRIGESLERIAGGKGDLTGRLPVPGRDEVSDLAGAFNRLMASLQELVREVQEASAELERSSAALAGSMDDAGRSASQVSETISQMARGTDEQTRLASDAGDQMRAAVTGVERLNALSERMTASATVAVEQATTGERAVEAVVMQVRRIDEAAVEWGRRVQALEQRSEAIREIVGSITAIADQTNLLALNAAIEAARAGQHGRGFAVVADEVRKLAAQAHDAAQEIGSLLGQIGSDTRSAVEAMDAGRRSVSEGTAVAQEARRQFGELRSGVGTLVSNIEEVATTARELARRIEAAGSAVQQMVAVIEESAAGAQEIAASAHGQASSFQSVAAMAGEVAAQAERLAARVGGFKV